MSRRRSRRKRYEFDNQTKYEAKKRAGFRCEICGKPTNLEVHHRIAIWFARDYMPQLAASVIKSLANAEVLCSDCHKQIHDNYRESGRGRPPSGGW